MRLAELQANAGLGRQRNLRRKRSNLFSSMHHVLSFPIPNNRCICPNTAIPIQDKIPQWQSCSGLLGVRHNTPAASALHALSSCISISSIRHHLSNEDKKDVHLAAYHGGTHGARVHVCCHVSQRRKKKRKRAGKQRRCFTCAASKQQTHALLLMQLPSACMQA